MRTRYFYGLLDAEGGGAGAGAGGSGGAPGAGSGGAGTLLEGSGAGAGGGGGQGSSSAGGGAGGGSGQGQGGGGSVVVKPFRDGWISADGKINKEAYDRLPDTLKPFKDTFAKYDTDEQLLSAFAHSVSLNGKKGLMPLPANASDADKQAFNGRLRELLNVPEKPEGYGVIKPKDLPDDQWNEPYVKDMVGILHKHNVPPAAVKELLEADQKHAQTMRGGVDAASLKAMETNRAEVAQAFGSDFDKNLGLARRMAATLGIDMKDPAIGNNAKVIIALHKAAMMVSEDKLVQPNGGGATGGVSDREKARDIVFNKSNPMNAAYHDPAHGNHAAAVAQVEAYNRAAAAAGVK